MTKQEAQRVGADDFLTKPFQSIRQLVSKVSDLLERTGENAEMSSSAAASGFAETQEMPQPVASESPAYEAPRYDDANIDDEMIQTSSPSNFAFDEAPKFASRNYVEPQEEDYGKTQPLSAADLREIESAPEEPVYQAQETTSASETAPTSQSVSRFDSDDDDDDLLEIPFDEDEFEDEEEAETVQTAQAASQTSGESETIEAESEISATAEAESVEPAAETENIQAVEAENVQTSETESAAVEAKSAQPEETMAASASSQLSAEMIDAIAQRVIEKLSDQRGQGNRLGSSPAAGGRNY